MEIDVRGNSKESNHEQRIGKKLCLGGRCLWGNG